MIVAFKTVAQLRGRSREVKGMMQTGDIRRASELYREKDFPRNVLLELEVREEDRRVDILFVSILSTEA